MANNNDEIKNHIECIKQIIKSESNNISSEEDTKTHLILPFIKNVLGYDKPSSLSSEVTASNQQKVDYALYAPNGEQQIVIECKALGTKLDKWVEKLIAYMSGSDARIGCLTNGKEYRFFIQLSLIGNNSIVSPFTINILNVSSTDIVFINSISYDNYDLLAAEFFLSIVQKLRMYGWELSDSLDTTAQLQTNNVISKSYEESSNKRGTRFNFDMVGIVPGDVLTYRDDETLTAKVLDSQRIEYDGEITYLSSAVRKITGDYNRNHGIEGPRYWKFNGKTLYKIRQEREN